MKIQLSTIFLSLLLLPVLVFAASSDVTMDSSSVITVGGYNLTVSGSASFDSITVNADNFTIVLSKNATLSVTSSDRRDFTVSPVLYKKSFTCGSSESSMTIANDVWDSAVTVTVTPLSSACAQGGGGVSSGGGGGGGGGGTPTPTYTVIPGTAVETPSIVAVSTTPTVTPIVSSVGVSVVFTTNLKYGVTSFDVKRLQQILNSDPDTQIAASGTGSPGSESEYFGSMTREAVKKFQKKHDIVSSGTEQTTGYGAVGPTTRAKLESVFGKAAVAPVTPAPTVAQPSAVAVSVSPVFTSGLSKGTSNSDVKRLQQLLNTDPDTQIAASGAGSAGNESEYFGSMTEKAVQKFQEKYNIAKKGDEGYGTVGPKTRANIEKVFKGASQQTPTTSETATLEAQIQALLQQVQALQAQLNTAQ